MKLIIVNGSPRGKNGNTASVLNSFIEGFRLNKKNSYELFYLKKDSYQAISQALKKSDTFILSLPLYISSMPGMVKEFIEHLSPLCSNDSNPAIGFIVQSGFPEAIQSRCLEKYFEKLSVRLNCTYLGTIIKGDCGSALANSKRKGPLLSSFYDLGKTLGRSGSLDADIIRELAQPEQISKKMQIKMNFLLRLGVFDGHFNNKLRGNNAFEKRLNMPYIDPARSLKWYVILRHNVNEFLRSRYEYWTKIKGFIKGQR